MHDIVGITVNMTLVVAPTHTICRPIPLWRRISTDDQSCLTSAASLRSTTFSRLDNLAYGRFVCEVPIIAAGALVDSEHRAFLSSPISERLGGSLGIALLAAVLFPLNIHEVCGG